MKNKNAMLSLLIGCVMGLVAGMCHVRTVMDRQEVTIPKEAAAPVSIVIQTPAPVPEPTPYLDPEIPEDVQTAARKAGEMYGIEPEFLEAVAWKESGYDAMAVSQDGSCVGLMQIAPKWHAERMERLGYDAENLLTTEVSMMIGADYLSELFDEHDDPCWVLMTYNGDSKAGAYRTGMVPPSRYAQAIMDKYEELMDRHREHVGAGN